MDPVTHPIKDIEKVTFDEVDNLVITFKEEGGIGEAGGLPEAGGAPLIVKPPSYPKPLSTDSISLTLDDATFKFDDATGNMLIPDVTIVKEIVQDYHDGDKIIKVFKSADEIKAAADLMDGVWICADHPKDENGSVRLVAGKEDIGGKVLTPRFVADENGNRIVCDLEITCPKIIADVKSSKTREVSIGFQSKNIEGKGKFGDDEYTLKQTGIFIDHVAIVENGRCSLNDGCGIVSADDEKPPAEGQPGGKPAEKTEAEKRMFADAEKIVKEEREKLENAILTVSDSRTKEELAKEDLGKLQKDFAFITDAKRKAQKSVGIVADREIDEKDTYAKQRKELDKVYGCEE